MCRVLSYLGRPIQIDELLYYPDNSLIKQSYQPKFIHLLNLAGFGMIAADQTVETSPPLIYKTTQLPFYDENLYNLSYKIKSNCLLAHIRGVAYNEKQIITNQNVHPFIFSGSKISLAHNGFLKNFNEMKYDLVKYIKKKYLECIRGTTDSEWIYALFLSQLSNSEVLLDINNSLEGLIKTFSILRKVRIKNNLVYTSPINLFITDGTAIVATRYAFDYGWPYDDVSAASHLIYHSLWYTYGDRYGYFDNEYKMSENLKTRSLIIASEPLTNDYSTWIEVPEYTFIYAELKHDEIKFKFIDLTDIT